MFVASRAASCVGSTGCLPLVARRRKLLKQPAVRTLTGLRTWVANYLQSELRRQKWEQMPERIILLRHGESEANVNPSILAKRPDNVIGLTERGREQAAGAGERIRKLVGEDARVSVFLSPFERTQQTLCSLLKTLGEGKVDEVHVDPRVREQEFGNFLDLESYKLDNAWAELVGRFYYRRDNGESSADVYDRVSDWWESMISGEHYRLERHFEGKSSVDDVVLVVTHGLTMRLLLMRYFGWSVDTFESVYNPRNCDTWTLRKCKDRESYMLCISESYPARHPFATRQIRVHMKSGAVEEHTVVDFLSLPQPRTSHAAEALRLCVPGHIQCDPNRGGRIDDILSQVVAIDPADVDHIDWWCGRIDESAKSLRTNLKFIQVEETPPTAH